MKIKLNKNAAVFISIFLTVLITVCIVTTYDAQMYVIGSTSGTRREDQNNNDRSNGPVVVVGPNNSGPNSVGPNSTIPNVAGNNNSGSFNSVGGFFTNPLTGMATMTDISNNRPLAFSVSNQRGALPTNATNGISQADIIYEVLVEGGITRFVALYQDITNVGVIGSIRSARHYTVQLAEAYDAIFLHAGGSPLGYEEIENREITNLDEVSGLRAQSFRRDIHRIPGHTVLQYHSCVTSGAGLSQWLPRYDIRRTHEFGYSRRLSFTDNPIPHGQRAGEVGIKFSAAKDSIFIYDGPLNLYFMAQFESFFTDANNGAPVTFSNLLIIEIPISDLVGHGEGAGRQDMSTVGRGMGYYMSEGRFVRIYWHRLDKSSQFVYTYENGQEIELGRGKTYIGIVPDISNVFIT